MKEGMLNHSYPEDKITIIGGGIIGFMEAYYAYLLYARRKDKIRITIFEKNEMLSQTTVCNIVPSLTPDEILAVVPCGNELITKLTILFNKEGGLRVNDVENLNNNEVAEKFKKAVLNDSKDEKLYLDRVDILLNLGKSSMELWENIYENGDDDLKRIMEESNFNPCRNTTSFKLHDGYRIDLIYKIKNANFKANNMIQSYKALGFDQCKILSPQEVIELDPFLKEFCNMHVCADGNWQESAAALWRPGGCIDTQVFIPKFYEYLRQKMGVYINKNGEEKDCFQVKFKREVIKVELDKKEITGLSFVDRIKKNKHDYKRFGYVFCSGEAVGTLDKLGFKEPTSARFAGVSLMLNIKLPEAIKNVYSKLNHCMEIHQEGIILAWQARFKNGQIFIGIAGSKAFYGDKIPHKDQQFCKDRNLVQLNIINEILPQFISLAFEKDTKGQKLTEEDLKFLEEKGIAQRWTGARAVAYDGVPTFGNLYIKENGNQVNNARTTTGLGSGGASLAPVSVIMSNASKDKGNISTDQEVFGPCTIYNKDKETKKSFICKVLNMSNSSRSI